MFFAIGTRHSFSAAREWASVSMRISLEWFATELSAYNRAFAGGTVYTARRYLQHALSAMKPDSIVLGMDFRDLLLPAEQTPASYEARLSVNPDGTIESNLAQQWLRDLIFSTLSIDATLDSSNTIIANISGDSPDIQSGEVACH